MNAIQEMTRARVAPALALLLALAIGLAGCVGGGDDAGGGDTAKDATGGGAAITTEAADEGASRPTHACELLTKEDAAAVLGTSKLTVQRRTSNKDTAPEDQATNCTYSNKEQANVATLLLYTNDVSASEFEEDQKTANGAALDGLGDAAFAPKKGEEPLPGVASVSVLEEPVRFDVLVYKGTAKPDDAAARALAERLLEKL